MKTSNSQWRERLASQIPEALAHEIDVFETEITLRKQGKLDERLFAETLFEGERVWPAIRQWAEDTMGKKVQELAYPSKELTKGPNTIWDAPGMQRIKIPAYGLNAGQLEILADLSEEYSDGIAHITTRQDVQLHYVHIDGTPRRDAKPRAAAGITTREACGNSVRNVTAQFLCGCLPG